MDAFIRERGAGSKRRRRLQFSIAFLERLFTLDGKLGWVLNGGTLGHPYE
jgi:hypothetical protein